MLTLIASGDVRIWDAVFITVFLVAMLLFMAVRQSRLHDEQRPQK